MKSYVYQGDYDTITMAGVIFEKNKPVHVNEHELKSLQASGFWQSMINNGELAEAEQKPAAKTTAKATAKAAKINAKAPITND